MSSQWQSAPAPPPGSYGDGPSGPRCRLLAALRLDDLVDGLDPGVPPVILYAIDPILSNTLGDADRHPVLHVLEGGPSGATVGKKALGIRVYDFARRPIGYGRGFIRYFTRILSAIPFFLGYFWMIWDKEKQCWQDKFAGSVVVPVDAYPR